MVLIFYDSLFLGTYVRIRTPCVIIRTPYIRLDKLHIMNQSEKLQLHYL